MPVSATVDGNAVLIERGSLSVERIIEERSTASFSVVDLTGVATYSRGMPVEIKDPDSNVIFAGFIDTPGKARKGVGAHLIHDLTFMDNHYLADKRLIVKVYTSQTLKIIVEDIVTNYLAAEGITIGEVQTGPVIKSAIFNYVKSSDAFDTLKEISGFTWFIDNDKKLYFIDRTTNLAAWNLDNVTYRPIKGSVHLSGGNPLYRNRQYVRGGTALTTEQTEDFDADGTVTAFTVGYAISKAPTITEDAGGKSVGIKGIDSGKDYYWSKGSATVVAASAPANGVAVQVVYFGEYPLIARADSPVAVADRLAIEGSGTGIVEEIATEAQHDTIDGIRESAKGKILEFAREAERFTYRTVDSGLVPGTLQAITYSPFGFSAKDMLIESVSVTADGNVVYYDVSCITGPLMGSWSKFFSRILKRQDNMIRIGDEQLIVLFVQSETLSLSEATDRHEDAFPPDVSRWIAEPPAQGAGHHIRHEALALAEATAYLEKPTERYYWSDAAPSGKFPYTFPIVWNEPWPLWDFFTWG